MSFQQDLFGANPQVVSIKNGEYIFIRQFFDINEANFYLKSFSENNNLNNSIQWKQEEMNMYGRVVKLPRKTAWYGDSDKEYSFSGIKLKPKGWTPELKEIKEKIELLANVQFNSVLLNLYRDGNDKISWHTDAEKELGENPVIASISLGATRTFQLRHFDTREIINIDLPHGSLLIMQGSLQHYWKHQLKPAKKNEIIGKRINLTFREIIN